MDPWWSTMPICASALPENSPSWGPKWRWTLPWVRHFCCPCEEGKYKRIQKEDVRLPIPWRHVRLPCCDWRDPSGVWDLNPTVTAQSFGSVWNFERINPPVDLTSYEHVTMSCHHVTVSWAPQNGQSGFGCFSPETGQSHMGVSWNRGTPKSSIFMGISLINHSFLGASILGHPHMSLLLLTGNWSLLCQTTSHLLQAASGGWRVKDHRSLVPGFALRVMRE